MKNFSLPCATRWLRRRIRDDYVYFGPTSPKGFEKNWIQTVPGKAWFVGFRFYAPTKAYFDKSWPLPDVELMK
jgi:hypothetical protein